MLYVYQCNVCEEYHIISSSVKSKEISLCPYDCDGLGNLVSEKFTVPNNCSYSFEDKPNIIDLATFILGHGVTHFN